VERVSIFPRVLDYAAPPAGDAWDHMPVWLRLILAASAWGLACFSIAVTFWIAYWLCAH
jgi:hypothetical protein